jgi:hypothetical protein
LEGSEVLLVEKVGENLLVNFKVECTMLHREDVDEVVEDFFLNKIVNPILPSFLLLVDWCLKDDRGQDIVDLFELLIYKKIVKVAIFCLFEYFFGNL